MRLPALTAEHLKNEASRELHETLYQHFLDRSKHVIPVTPDTIEDMQGAISGNLRKFWLARGFKVKTKRDACHKFLWVWLAPCEQFTERPLTLAAVDPHADFSTGTPTPREKNSSSFVYRAAAVQVRSA